MSKANPHRAWLMELRHLRLRLSSGLDDEYPGTAPGLKQQIRALQDQIIDTAPTSKSEVLIQVELLKDMAWADPVRRLGRSISMSISRLWSD